MVKDPQLHTGYTIRHYDSTEQANYAEIGIFRQDLAGFIIVSGVRFRSKNLPGLIQLIGAASVPGACFSALCATMGEAQFRMSSSDSHKEVMDGQPCPAPVV